MAEKTTATWENGKRSQPFPLPKGEGQGEGKTSLQKANVFPNLKPVARMLRKNDTWAERLLWSWVRDRRFSGHKFRRQHQFGPHILDFFCLEAWLNIELDGSQHGFPEHKRRDVERDAWLEERGFKVLRFWNSRLRREKEVVRDTIWRALQERARHPLPEYCTKILDNVDGNSRLVSPHPGPFPWGEGESQSVGGANENSPSLRL